MKKGVGKKCKMVWGKKVWGVGFLKNKTVWGSKKNGVGFFFKRCGGAKKTVWVFFQTVWGSKKTVWGFFPNGVGGGLFFSCRHFQVFYPAEFLEFTLLTFSILHCRYRHFHDTTVFFYRSTVFFDRSTAFFRSPYQVGGSTLFSLI